VSQRSPGPSGAPPVFELARIRPEVPHPSPTCTTASRAEHSVAPPSLPGRPEASPARSLRRPAESSPNAQAGLKSATGCASPPRRAIRGRTARSTAPGPSECCPGFRGRDYRRRGFRDHRATVSPRGVTVPLGGFTVQCAWWPGGVASSSASPVWCGREDQVGKRKIQAAVAPCAGLLWSRRDQYVAPTRVVHPNHGGVREYGVCAQVGVEVSEPPLLIMGLLDERARLSGAAPARSAASLRRTAPIPSPAPEDQDHPRGPERGPSRKRRRSGGSPRRRCSQRGFCRVIQATSGALPIGHSCPSRSRVTGSAGRSSLIRSP
jgi:hypothetical protein